MYPFNYFLTFIMSLLLVATAMPTKEEGSSKPGSSLQSSTWSKLQISPDEIGSMPYGHYGLNIYGHSGNAQQPDESKKRYYYTPVCELNHQSAVSSFNNVTGKAQVLFRVEMWNDALEQQVLNYTSRLVGYSLKPEQIRVLPLEKVQLSSEISSDNYELPNVWNHYQRHQFLWFSLVCPSSRSPQDCDYLANDMKSNPSQFEHLRLTFSLSSQTTQRQDVVIRVENIMAGELMGRINQRYPNANEVLLTERDEKEVLTESFTNIIVEYFDDSETKISPRSEQVIYDILNTIIVSSRWTLKPPASNQTLWKSVFWDDEPYRPDKIANVLNDIYKKLPTEISKQKLIRFQALEENEFITTGFSDGEMIKIIREAQNTVEWDGDNFVPKTITLSRISLGKLRNKNFFQERKIRVSYITAMLYISLYINKEEGRKKIDLTPTNEELTEQMMELRKETIIKISDLEQRFSKIIEGMRKDVQMQQERDNKQFNDQLSKTKKNILNVTQSVERNLYGNIEGLKNEVNIRLDDDKRELNRQLIEMKNGISNVSQKLNKSLKTIEINQNETQDRLKGFGRNVSDLVTGITENLRTEMKNMTATNGGVIPVFMASTFTDTLLPNQYVTYRNLEIGERSDTLAWQHGQFDRLTGIFTAKTSGIYLFLFHTLVKANTARAYLRVNGATKAVSATQPYNHADSLIVSSVVKVENGDQAGIFIGGERVWLSNDGYTHFSGLLLSY